MKNLLEVFGRPNTLYADNKKNIVRNDDIIIDIENIRFQTIFRSFGGSMYRQPGKKFCPAHTHPYYEIHVTYDENAMLDIEDTQIHIPPAQALMVFPNTYHHFPDGNAPLSQWNMALHITKKEHQGGSDYYTPFMEALNQHNGFCIIPSTSPFVEYMEKIRLYAENMTPIKWNMIKSLLSLMFSELVLLFGAKDDAIEINHNAINESDFRTQIIQVFFVKNYTFDITLGDLAAILKLSEKQTGRLVKKACGTDFQSYLTELRLKNAKRLLKETDDELQKIAENVGYKSYNGFYLAFKNAFGLSPMKYRKKYR